MAEFVRAFPYPVLEDGNLSFPNGIYDQEFKRGKDNSSVVLTHTLQGAHFLEHLISQGKAVFACAVSIPVTGYRKLHVSREAKHEIFWEPPQLGEPPYFRSLILITKRIKHTLTKEDEVGPEWIDQKITLERGTKIAFGSFYRMSSCAEQLVAISEDSNLDKGSFLAQPCASDGFYFDVKVASDLYTFLKVPGESRSHCDSIATHIVSSCFSILQKEYSDDNEQDSWRAHSNLRALAQELDHRGLKTWFDEGFSPEKAATVMYPHKVPNVMSRSDSYDLED